ncbi:unnamed protein product [Hanseniaspora opuntiae]
MRRKDDNAGKENKINKLLAKASTLDDINNAEDPSNNNSTGDDEEWDIIETNSKSEGSGKVETPKKVSKPEVENKQTLKSPVKQEHKETVVKSEVKTPSAKKTVEPEVMTPSVKEVAESDVKTPSTPKTLSIKQSVEKLSGLVLDLTTIIEGLKTANLEKDERLKALEAKVDQLMTKK